MPRTTVYIRNDDYDNWKLIKNKAELISQAINRSVINPVMQKNGKIRTEQTIIPPSGSPSDYAPPKKIMKSKPAEKRISQTTLFCKEHGMEKQYCKLMKHEGKS